MNVVVDQIAKAVKARARASSSAGKPVRLCVLVSRECNPELAGAVRQALRPETVGCRLHVVAMGEGVAMPEAHASSDAAIILAGEDTPLVADVYDSFGAKRVPCVVLVAMSAEMSVVDELVRRGVAAEDIAVCDAWGVPVYLGGWLVGSLPDLADALGAGFACCRDALTKQVVAETVRNNAMVGALTFLKGADTPVMMANEVAMIYRLSSINGLSMDEERVPELACVVFGSFIVKTLAKYASSRLPLPAPLVKSAVAAVGTLAAGAVVNMRQRQLAGAQKSGERQA